MVFAKLGGNKEQIWGQLPPRSPWLRHVPGASRDLRLRYRTLRLGLRFTARRVFFMEDTHYLIYFIAKAQF